MRIGILGGTFDPIHNGHLLMAEQAREWKKLDEVWFIPVAIPPHKQHKQISPTSHRVEMVKKAVADHPHFQVSEIECNREGPSYTVDTLQELCNIHPNFEFYLIIGADMVKDLPNWYKIKEILQMTQIIGIHRPGFDNNPISASIGDRVEWLPDGIEIKVSSTFIRKHIHNERIMPYIVPEQVYQYIKEYSLYEY